MRFEDIRTIAVIAPAGPLAREPLLQGLAQLEAMGKRVKIMPQVFSGCESAYLAAEAEDRAADLTAAWLDPEVDCLLAARGGFGSAHLLPLLDWDRLRRRTIPLLGGSDVTALHFAMEKFQAGLPVAAPMAGKFAVAMADAYTEKEFLAAFSGPAERRIDPPAGESFRILKPGKATARPLAGNLAVAASLCGTAYLPSAAGRLVILEDLNEPPYKVDRYLTQLQQSGFFTGCAGIAFGSFLNCGEPAEVERILRRAVDWTAGPVAANFPFGHAFPLASLNFRQKICLEGEAGKCC